MVEVGEGSKLRGHVIDALTNLQQMRGINNLTSYLNKYFYFRILLWAYCTRRVSCSPRLTVRPAQLTVKPARLTARTVTPVTQRPRMTYALKKMRTATTRLWKSGGKSKRLVCLPLLLLIIHILQKEKKNSSVRRPSRNTQPLSSICSALAVAHPLDLSDQIQSWKKRRVVKFKKKILSAWLLVKTVKVYRIKLSFFNVHFALNN